MAQVILQQHKHAKTYSGLNAEEIQERIKKGQSNHYQVRVSRSYWDIFRDNVLNLFNIILFTLLFIVLYFRDYGTVFFAGFSVVSNTFMGMIQEMQAKRRLDKLAALTQQKALVWRNGQRQEIPMREVVVDDLLILEPGVKAVVDGQIVDSDALEMDESLLTGESDAVFKERSSEILSGSFCIAGAGVMKATRVGKQSNISKLSEIAKAYKNLRTPTQKRIDIVVEISVILMILFVPMLFISNLLVTQPALPFLQAVRNAVVFLTTLVPQGLVLTAILSLTIGAIKISRHDTLVQKVNAVESLANATVLCFDKTGTLTQNALAVDEILLLNQQEQNQVYQQLADYLANLAYSNRTAGAVQTFIERSHAAQNRDKEREIPFTSGRKWGAIIFTEETLILGAPERLLAPHDPALHTALKLSEEGKRILAFGQMIAPPIGDRIEGLMTPLALVVLSDQVRPDIHETLESFRREHIQLKVVSGDNLETVRAIARLSGMSDSPAYTGSEIDAMTDEQLQQIVQKTSVFARIEPESKRRIVKALQAQHEYVAMVGDGVNDVPALKQANLAIVMNDGTQISKDIADIVLLNNALSTLPRAFREGREITQTIFGTTKLFLIRGMHHVLLFIFVLFMGLPFPITPIQVSWATFGSINIPATLIAFAVIRPKFMKNFRDDVMDYIVTGGIIGAALLALIFTSVYLGTGRDVAIARSSVTIFIVLFNTFMILVIQGVDLFKPRTLLEHGRIALIMIGLATFTIATMYARPTTFEFVPISSFWILAIIVGSLIVGTLLFTQLIHHRYFLHRFWALLSSDDDKIAKIVRD